MSAMLNFFGKNYPSVILSRAVGIIVILFAPLCYADECSPLQITLWPSIQIVSQDSSICGGRLNLGWGKNTAVRGIDIGIVNDVGSIKGIQLGGFNTVSGWNKTESWGLQIAGANYSKDDKYTGVQIGLVNYDSNLDRNSVMNGFQIGIINGADEANAIQLAIFMNGTNKDFYGLQLAVFGNMTRHDMHGVQASFFVNGAMHDMLGVQAGLIGNGAQQDMHGLQLGVMGNKAWDMHGIQVSLVNEAREMHGLQIGFLNVVDNNVHSMQIGLINWCNTFQGVQLGIVNVITSRYSSGGLFFTPLVNVGF